MQLTNNGVAAFVVTLIIGITAVLLATPAQAKGPEIPMRNEQLITPMPGFAPFTTGCVGAVRVFVGPAATNTVLGSASTSQLAAVADPTCVATP